MSQFPLKGWMIDAARLPEPLPYYRRLIDFCSAWGLNALLFRLTDDQGSAFRFASHPELVTHPHAYTPAELAGLVAYAAARGVELIPEIESFGHTGYITRSPEHAQLLDVDPAARSSFTGVIPNHPATLAMMADLYREVAQIFPSRWLHAGCDEVNWGGSPDSQAQIAAHGRPAVWTDYLNRLNDLVRAQGKEMLIWADHVLPDPAVLAGLSRDIVLVDWSYWDTDPTRSDGPSKNPGPIEARARLALDAGFRLIGAPAWGWCRWGVRAGQRQLENIAAFADVYRALDTAPSGAVGGRNLGVIVTNWVPSRFIQNAGWDAPAYAAVALNEGSAAANRRAFPRFVEQHFGAAWTGDWADIYRTLYAITPPRRSCSSAWMAPFQPAVWASADELAAAIRTPDLPVAFDLPFARLGRQLAACRSAVCQNLPDFDALALAVEYLEHIHWRCAAVRDPQLTPETARPLIQEIARRDAQLAAALEQEWDHTRFPDSPGKSVLLADLSPADQTLFTMRQAANFTAHLAEHPEEFSKAFV